MSRGWPTLISPFLGEIRVGILILKILIEPTAQWVPMSRCFCETRGF